VSAAAHHVLVSFCNVARGGPVLAIVDVATGEVRVLDVPERLSCLAGITGLTVLGRYLFAVTSRSNPTGRGSVDPPGPSLLLAFDRTDLRLLHEHKCSTVFDAHSLWAWENELYVVSTGTDAVVRLGLRGPEVIAEQVRWRPDPAGPAADVHHLNAICSWGGRLVVSGFGPKADLPWSSATDGFIVDVATGESVVSGVSHPHSLTEVDGALAYCESSSRAVRLVGRSGEQRLPGYARGMCRVGDRLFVATSRARRVSKSTGALTSLHDAGAELQGGCTLIRLTDDTLAIEEVINLEAYGGEIYDLLSVSAVQQWPIADEIAWRNAALRGLRESFDERDSTISALHIEVAQRDRTVGSLHQEVAKRDRTIAWLHGEVAARDQIVARGRTERAEE
jgi:hypothetical protein